MNHSHSELQTLLQKVRWGVERGGFSSRVGRAAARAVFLGLDDKVTCELVEAELRPLQKQEFLGSLPPFKAGRFNARQLRLGNDIHGGFLYLLYSWLLAGLLLVANTGGGKSNLLAYLALQMASVCPLWFSESYKTQLRLLRPLLQRLGIDLIILNGRDWRWNLLQPHIRDIRLHLTLVVDLLVRVLDLPPRGRSILVRGLHELYRRHGVWNGNQFAIIIDVLSDEADDGCLDGSRVHRDNRLTGNQPSERRKHRAQLFGRRNSRRTVGKQTDGRERWCLVHGNHRQRRGFRKSRRRR